MSKAKNTTPASKESVYPQTLHPLSNIPDANQAHQSIIIFFFFFFFF